MKDNDPGEDGEDGLFKPSRPTILGDEGNVLALKLVVVMMTFYNEDGEGAVISVVMVV